MSNITIMIAEDQPLIRDGLAAILNMEEKYKVVARTGDGLTALEQMRVHQPHLVLMDIHMPQLNGLEAAKQILSEFPHTKILFLTTFEDEQYMLEALRIGASGFLIKGMHTDSVLATIEACLTGRISYPASIQAHLIQALQDSSLLERSRNQSTANHAASVFNIGEAITGSVTGTAADKQPARPQLEIWNILTPQERKIVELLKLGKTNQYIANELYLTTGTVKNYLYSIYKKLNVNNRSEAIALLYNSDI